MRFALSVLAVAVATPAIAADAPVIAPVIVSVETPTPERLAAATDLMEALYPEAQRGAMFDSVFSGLMRSISASIQPMMAKANFPGAEAILDRFMQRTIDRTKSSLITAMPGMFQAFSEAYARKFSVAELADIKAFFQTPSGQRYLSESMRLMEDPSVSAWQTKLMRDQMGNVEKDVEELTREIIQASEAAKDKGGSY